MDDNDNNMLPIMFAGTEQIMVLDGDFETQLRTRMKLPIETDQTFMLHALKLCYQYDVCKTYLEFLINGAQIIRTNTYRTVGKVLIKYLGIKEAEGLLLIAHNVKVIKTAIKRYYELMLEDGKDLHSQLRPLIAGLCGSCAAANFDNLDEAVVHAKHLTLEYLKYFHRPRVNTLLNAGVDLLTFECIPSLKEAKAVIELLKDYPKARALITFLCTQKMKIVDGSDLVEAIKHCYDYYQPRQILAFGFACYDWQSPNALKPLLEKINENRSSKIPLMCYVQNTLFSYGFADKPGFEMQQIILRKWLDMGVRYVGGGVGMIPENMKVLCKTLRRCVRLKESPTTNSGYSCS
ncbi:PREDICTED: homocysteine S-methyltransferase 1-like [Dinoponera quadriceps]|uniref:Homocysteine S-methyltransferase 1-like n=1 Tax=Dinoponera quadriceps TaxID=609295 RepID=A0A6P3WYY3_DINQU|nr:PREDICTED: homocysteine S-methyltransferase 1-like [Dinoponera quadriceps]